MSLNATQKWLLSNKIFSEDHSFTSKKAAVKISIASGKGGVGKTSVALKLSQKIAEEGYKILLIDCDYNLSNTQVKLGLPINDNFQALIRADKRFDECIHKDGDFHLLSACNGDLEFFDKGLELDKFITDIIAEHESEYDFIILDCPAGLSRNVVNLNAYSDHRIIVVNPDRSSITDSYSLIKILNKKFGISDNHLLVNKVSSSDQYKRVVNTLSQTVETYLQSRLKILGGIPKVQGSVDAFDRILMEKNAGELDSTFAKVAKKLTDQTVVPPRGIYTCVDDFEQDVQSTAC